MRQHPSRRAVIVFATGSEDTYGPYSLIPYPWFSIRETMKSIIDLNGIIVVSAGNRRAGRARRGVDTLPAFFNGPDLPLIVAGSVDTGGTLAPFSQGPDYVDIWAPGVGVSCTRPNIAAQLGTGTSQSAGMVSLITHASLNPQQQNAEATHRLLNTTQHTGRRPCSLFPRFRRCSFPDWSRSDSAEF